MSNNELCLLAIVGFLAFLVSGFTTSGIRQSQIQQPSQSVVARGIQ